MKKLDKYIIELRNAFGWLCDDVTLLDYVEFKDFIITRTDNITLSINNRIFITHDDENIVIYDTLKNSKKMIYIIDCKSYNQFEIGIKIYRILNNIGGLICIDN